MKKRNIILLTITLLLIGTLSFNIYQKQSIQTNKKDVSDNSEIGKFGSIYVYTRIDKRDENANPLSGARFQVSPYNNVESFASRTRNSYYYVDEEEEGRDIFNTAKAVLSKEQKTATDAIHTLADFRNVEYGNEVYCYHDEYSDSEREEEYYLPSGFYCSLKLPTIFYIEETKAPAGYSKEKVIIPGTINMIYHVKNYPESLATAESTAPQFRIAEYLDEGNFDVELVQVHVYTEPSPLSIDYGTINEELLVGLDWDANDDYWYEYANIGRICESIQVSPAPATLPNHQTIKEHKLPESAALCDAAYIVNKRGTVTLEASNFVNNVESITTKVNQTLEYKVIIKNTSNVDSIDNVVTANLPEGFIYVDGSASDNGIQSESTIKWSVPRLKAGEEVTFTYKAFAPKTVSPGVDYVGTASVESINVDKKVESNRTMVRLALNNPNTFGTLEIVIVVLIMAMWVVFLVGKQYIQQQQQQTQE